MSFKISKENKNIIFHNSDTALLSHYAHIKKSLKVESKVEHVIMSNLFGRGG